MTQVAVNKVGEGEMSGVPVFDEIRKRIECVQQRAYDLFEKRGRELGHQLEDWLRAEREMCWPAAELVEKNGAYLLEVTLPGFEAKEIEVTATANEIIVHAARKEEKAGEKGEVVWSEFGANDVCRRFELAKPVRVEEVTATIEKGLLKIKAPVTVAKPVIVKVAAA